MKRGDPMDALQAYYARLDHESPAAASFVSKGDCRRRELFARTATVLAPVLAAAFAYGFLALCASTPASGPSPLPSGVYENQLRMVGLDMRSMAPSPHHPTLLRIPTRNS